MKHFMIMIVCLSTIFFSCKKEETNMKISQNNVKESTNSRASSTISAATVAATYTESDVVPRFGKPNSTYYYFKVAGTNSLALSVKLFARTSGLITYIPMTYSGGYWTLSTKIMTNDWYDWRYVYTATNGNISSTAYTLCNTYNTFSSTGTSSIRWPFGADGSSWSNRNNWIGAREPGGCGQKWYTDYTGTAQQQTGHKYYSCGADDSYAEDWNKDCSTPNADLGSYFASPLDGKVIKVTIDAPSNHWGGYGNSVDIEQETSIYGDPYIFRIAHLQYTPLVSVGQSVRAGVTLLGQIGMSGGTSTAPHAHMVLYKKINGCYSPMKFSINANGFLIYIIGEVLPPLYI